MRDGSLSLDKVNVKDEQTQLVLLVLCPFFWFVSSLWHLKESRQKIRGWYHLCACVCTLILTWFLIVFKVRIFLSFQCEAVYLAALRPCTAFSMAVKLMLVCHQNERDHAMD